MTFDSDRPRGPRPAGKVLGGVVAHHDDPSLTDELAWLATAGVRTP
ncbi:hypothetical protein [Winogradskya consettensis]|nr:hypothetical protein [Actinoplanes consettensis]